MDSVTVYRIAREAAEDHLTFTMFGLIVGVAIVMLFVKWIERER